MDITESVLSDILVNSVSFGIIKDDKGGKKTVKILPRLTEEKIKGKPCMVTVKHREWEDKTYANVNRVDIWEKGVEYEGDDNDLPF